MKALRLHFAIKSKDIETIREIIDDFPIDEPISDTGMTALGAACSFCADADD